MADEEESGVVATAAPVAETGKSLSEILPQFSDVTEPSSAPSDKDAPVTKEAAATVEKEAQTAKEEEKSTPGSKTSPDQLLAALHEEREEKRALREENKAFREKLSKLEQKLFTPAEAREAKQLTEAERAANIEAFLSDPDARVDAKLDARSKKDREEIAKMLDEKFESVRNQVQAERNRQSEREFRRENKDYDEVVFKSGFFNSVKDSKAMCDIINNSDNPAETAYRMAIQVKFPERLEAEKESKIRQSVLETLGLSEEAFEQHKARKAGQTPKPTVKPVVKAEPPSRLGDIPAAGAAAVPNDGEDFNSQLPFGKQFA